MGSVGNRPTKIFKQLLAQIIEPKIRPDGVVAGRHLLDRLPHCHRPRSCITLHEVDEKIKARLLGK